MGMTVFFGGTFNPPHNAHKKMLSTALRLPYVDKILVVPTNIPPHKAVKGYFACNDDRMKMCRLLCDVIDKTDVSDMEIKRGGKSYSYDTLCELSHTCDELGLLIGGDMLASFKEWYNYQGILKLATVIAVKRPGVDDAKTESVMHELEASGGRVVLLHADMPDISSTSIRLSAKSGDRGALKSVLPENIYDYIEKRGLYLEASI